MLTRALPHAGDKRRCGWLCARVHRTGVLSSQAPHTRATGLTLPRAQDVAKHPVLVFMKGTPTAPQCGFSNMVCRILDSYGACAAGVPRLHRAQRCVRMQASSTPAATCCRTPSCERASRRSRAWLPAARHGRKRARLTRHLPTAGAGRPFRRCSWAASSWCVQQGQQNAASVR